MDEVCRRRGQNYLTIASEPRSGQRPRRVLLVIEGRDCRSLKEFRDHSANCNARGFNSVEYFTATLYRIGSHLDFDLPDPFPVTHAKSS